MTIPNASSCTRLLTPSFSLYRFVVSRTSGAQYICPLSSRTAQRTIAGPAQAVTSHRPISKSWWGSRQETRTTARAAGPAKTSDARTASARHPAAQPRPGRRRRGGSMTASARHPAAQPRPGRRRRPRDAMTASARHPAARPRPELRRWRRAQRNVQGAGREKAESNRCRVASWSSGLGRMSNMNASEG